MRMLLIPVVVESLSKSKGEYLHGQLRKVKRSKGFGDGFKQGNVFNGDYSKYDQNQNMSNMMNY